MESNAEVVEVLHNLMKINKARVEAYKNASYNTSDPGLKGLFGNMADQSRKNITDIIKEIINHNGSEDISEATSGNKIYEAWENFKHKTYEATWRVNAISLLAHNKKNWDVIATSQFR